MNETIINIIVNKRNKIMFPSIDIILITLIIHITVITDVFLPKNIMIHRSLIIHIMAFWTFSIFHFKTSFWYFKFLKLVYISLWQKRIWLNRLSTFCKHILQIYSFSKIEKYMKKFEGLNNILLILSLQSLTQCSFLMFFCLHHGKQTFLRLVYFFYLTFHSHIYFDLWNHSHR